MIHRENLLKQEERKTYRYATGDGVYRGSRFNTTRSNDTNTKKTIKTIETVEEDQEPLIEKCMQSWPNKCSLEWIQKH